MSKKIKSVRLFKHDNAGKKDSDQGNKGYKYSMTDFDENGNVVLEVRFNPDEELEDKYIYKYDNKNQLIEEIHYLSYKDIAEHKTYDIDEKGKIVKVYKHYNDGSKDTIEHRYNENDLLIEQLTIDSYEEIEAKNVYGYENENLILEEVYEYDELISKQSFSYDEKGNIIEENKWTEDDGNLRRVNEYDKNDKLVKVLFYNKKEELAAKTEYSYNESGKINEVTEEDQHGKNTTTIQYDDKGNAVEQVEINPNGDVNNKAIRKFNENNDVVETDVFIDLHGAGPNQEYVLRYEYDYYE